MTDTGDGMTSGSWLTNPFVVESPEKLRPEQIVELFIGRFTRLDVVRQRRHTFAWGSRGSGKSMTLRYLEPQCQALVHDGDIGGFLKGTEPFIAVYCPCKEGQMNKTELGLLDKSSLVILSEHMLNLIIADRLVDCLRRQFPCGFFSQEELSAFAQATANLFDRASIASSVNDANRSVGVEERPLDWLQELFAAESRRVGAFLRSNALQGGGATYGGATSGYHDFLLPMMKAVQGLRSISSVPIFLLLDDADRLTEDQQMIVNTWIANRDQATVCLKVSAQREGYRTFLTRDGGLVEQPHDYSEVDFDELYTRSKSDYAERLRLIAERRLALSGVGATDIAAFLPPDPTETELLDRFKKETAEEWRRVSMPGRQSDFVNRYATARLFQHLRATKKRKSYAGFENMMHLSSGIVRDFLEPCYLMFSACVSQAEAPESVQCIPPAVQNDVLFRYCEEFLVQKVDDIRRGLPPEKWTQVERLYTLVQSLGRLFYERLHDPEAREARLFSFTVRGSVDEDVDEVLRLGITHRYFQLRTYSTKEGGGRERWYILNRRLCPVFKLDPTGFEGRISLTPNLLRLACEDPEKFVRMRLKKSEDDPQRALFTLQDEDAAQ
jgi:hypothetical protein